MFKRSQAGTQGRNTKAGTTEEHFLLACSQTHLSYTSQTYLLMDGTSCAGLGSPNMSIGNRKTALQTWPQMNVMGENSSIKVSSALVRPVDNPD